MGQREILQSGMPRGQAWRLVREVQLLGLGGTVHWLDSGKYYVKVTGVPWVPGELYLYNRAEWLRLKHELVRRRLAEAGAPVAR